MELGDIGDLLGGVGAIKGHQGVRQCQGWECRYLGARRGIGSIRGHWGSPRGVGAVRGCQGCRGALGWQVDWESNHIGPQSGSQHSHWFPLGSDLPHQGQARGPVEGPITPTGFPWGVTYLAKAKQVTEMSSAGYYIHLELYFMIVCTFVSTPPLHIFLHAM